MDTFSRSRQLPGRHVQGATGYNVYLGPAPHTPGKPDATVEVIGEIEDGASIVLDLDLGLASGLWDARRQDHD